MKYLAGYLPHADYLEGMGQPTYEPKWVGPEGEEEYTREYIDQRVRGRGENRACHDLLIAHPAGHARLKRGERQARSLHP